MKKLHKIIAASLLASATTAGSGVVLAEAPLTANIGVTSNYIWRGITQTSDTSAVSGGIDYAHASGFHVGIWTSNESWTTTPGYEQDLYAGYSIDAGPVGLDLGYIKYMYPIGTGKDDFDEVYVNASISMFNAGVALTTAKEVGGKTNDMYVSVGAKFEVKKDLILAVTYGNYDFENTATIDYSHIQISLSKDNFTFAYDDNDLPNFINDSASTAGDPRLSVSWSKDFDL